MSRKIEYENKIALQNNESIPERNKVTDMNMNEIKSVVNSHADEIENISDIDINIQEYLEKLDVLEQKYDEQIEELANENPQLPEIVDARQGFNTLGSIIKQKIFHFNSVADMKNCLTLLPGDVVQTLGYYEENDGGGGLYKIINDVTLEDDGGSVHILTSGLRAKLIINDSINVNQFGAKGDGINDDTLAIQNALDFARGLSQKIKIILLNKIYKFTNLIIHSKNILQGLSNQNSILKVDSTASGDAILINEIGENYIILNNFKVDGSDNNSVTTGINNQRIGSSSETRDSYTTIENINISDMPNIGIRNSSNARENRYNNIIIERCNGVGLYALASDSSFYNITVKGCGSNGIKVEGSNHRFVNCKCFYNGKKYADNPDNRFNYAGWRIVGGSLNTFTACDSQENYMDGWYIEASRNHFINCKGDANGISSNVGHDEELEYSGFYLAGTIEYITLIGMAGDFRRESGIQAQKVGLTLNNLSNSFINFECNQLVNDVEFSNGALTNNNLIIINGKIISDVISNILKLISTNDVANKMEFINSTQDEAYRLFSTDTKLQIDYRKNNAYNSTPLSIQGASKRCRFSDGYDLIVPCSTLSFFNTNTGSSKQTAVENATDLASVINLANNLKSILKNYGLIN